MPSSRRRLPVSPDAAMFEQQAHLINLAARLADLAFFGNVADYENEIAEANRHLSKAEAGFVAGYIACANARPEDIPPVVHEEIALAGAA